MARLALLGDWPLADVLAELSAQRGIRLRLRDAEGPPRLECGPGGPVIRLPGGAGLPQAIVESAVLSIAQCIEPDPAGVCGTVLVPAAGLCGPAPHGPIDAVRDAGYAYLEGRLPMPGSAFRLLQVQHTRCWVASLTFTGRHTAFRPAGTVRMLPDSLAADTARATQYMLDLGDGFYWREVAVAAPPEHSRTGRLDLLAMFTEAHYLQQLLASGLRLADKEKHAVRVAVVGMGVIGNGSLMPSARSQT